jgi:acyl-CoA thioesterase I
MTKTIVFYGDSETALFDWTDRVAADLGSSAKVINTAAPGQDSEWGLANLQERVLKYHPDVVFFEFSMNDAVAFTPDQAKNYTMEIVAEIKAANPHTRIFLETGVEPLFSVPGANPKQANVDAYYQGYRDVSHQAGVGLVDENPGWRILEHFVPWIMYNGSHPGIIADLAFEVPMVEQALMGVGIYPEVHGTRWDR